MNVSQLIRLPSEIFVEILHHLEFKDLAALEQSCKEIQAIICEKKIWGKLGESYGLFHDGKNIKGYLRNHTISNPEKLKERISNFFWGISSANNVFFKCLFKENSGMLEIERIQNTKEKNSLTVLYTSPLDENAKIKINQDSDDMLEQAQMLLEESFKKNLSWSRIKI